MHIGGDAEITALDRDQMEEIACKRGGERKIGANGVGKGEDCRLSRSHDETFLGRCEFGGLWDCQKHRPRYTRRAQGCYPQHFGQSITYLMLLVVEEGKCTIVRHARE